MRVRRLTTALLCAAALLPLPSGADDAATASEGADPDARRIELRDLETAPPGWGAITIESWRAGPAGDAPSAPAPDLAARPEAAPTPIRLREAVAIAVTSNPNIAVNKIDPIVAESAVGAQEGKFDVVAFADVNYSETREQTASTITGEQTDALQTDAGLRRALETGGALELKLSQDRTRTDSPVANLNPQYRARLDLTLTQPLLRGAGLDFAGLEIEIARTSAAVSREVFVSQVSQTVADVENAYWDLLAAQEALEVARQSLALAEKLQRDNEVQVQVGTLAPIEVLQAKTAVARREEELLIADNRVENAQDQLRALLGYRAHEGVAFRPSDDPAVDARRLDADEELRKAYEKRPDYRQARLNLQSRSQSLKLSENALLPKLDLAASAGLNGLSGAPQAGSLFAPTSLSGTLNLETTPIGIPGITAFPFTADLAPSGGTSAADRNLSGSWGQALENMVDGRRRSWGVGVGFEIPLENRAAEAAFVSAKLEAHKARLQIRALEELILVEVRATVRNAETNLKRVKTTRVATQLAEEQLAAEEKKLEVGLSTNFQVLDFQDQLAQARLAEVQARADYARSLVNLQLRTGTLLDAVGVTIAD